MSPRHFTKAIYGPYYLSSQHYINAVPNTPQTKFEKFTYVLFKYTGINKFLDFYFAPPKISNKTEFLPYQENPGDQEIDLKQLRESRRSDQ
jgi:hypothetical protein